MPFRASPRTVPARIAQIEEDMRRLRQGLMTLPESSVLINSIEESTEIVYATNAELMPVAALEDDGSSDTVTRGDHVHEHGTGYDGGHTDGSSHSHDGAGTNSTIVGGVAEAGATIPVASGAQAVAVGDYAQATGLSSLALGAGTSAATAPDASGQQAVAIGSGDGSEPGPTASAYGTIAIGPAAAATGDEDIAIGYLATASGTQSVAVGESAVAAGAGSVVIGLGASSTAAATNSVAINGDAIGNISYAIGGSTASGATNAIAIGDGSYASAIRAINVGNAGASAGGGASADSSICIGQRAASFNDPRASGVLSIAIGSSTETSNSGNYGPRASGTQSIAVGGGTATENGAEASATDTIAVGVASIASAAEALAMGHGASAAHSAASALGQAATTTKADQIMLGVAAGIVTHPGAVEYQVATKTNTNYTLTVTDHFIRFSTGAVNRVATLPPVVAAMVGLVLIIKKVDAGAGIVTVTADTTGTPDLIDGAATFVLSVQYQSVTLIAAAADTWEIL